MLTEKDYSEININKTYLVVYMFCNIKYEDIIDGDILLEMENGGYDVLEYHPIAITIKDKLLAERYVNNHPFFGNSNKAYSKAQMLDAFLAGLKINANQIEKLEEKYKKLSKSVFELKGEFMACPLDDTKRIGELIDQLNNV